MKRNLLIFAFGQKFCNMFLNEKIIIILRLSHQLELPKGDHCWGTIVPQTSYFYPPPTIDVTVADPGGDTGVGNPPPRPLPLMF